MVVISEERRFQERTSACVVLAIAVVGGGMSLLWTVGALTVAQEPRWALFGILGLLVFCGLPVAIWYFKTSYAIVCRPDGFAVSRENRRKGNSSDEYRWDEVTATRYYEQRSSRDSGDRTTGYFSVDTQRGKAFDVSEGMRHFGDLIEFVNAKTPHLPYVWKRQGGGGLNVGGLSVGRGDYRQVPRAEQPSAPS